MAQKKSAKAPVKNLDELAASITKLQAELAEAKRSHASRELANTRRLKELRQAIARHKTALNQQKLNQENL